MGRPMNALVTGATGFIGRHLVKALLDRGHRVTALVRDFSRVEEFEWQNEVTCLEGSIEKFDVLGSRIQGCDTLFHLAWTGLPNYGEAFHFEKNLFTTYDFIKKVIAIGCRHVLVAGTCFEYGMQEGSLREDLPANPTNAYGLAKDALRRFLQQLQIYESYRLIWPRLFYLYGPGQAERSLISQLEKAVRSHRRSFRMSPGDQIRDFLSVEDASVLMVKLVEAQEFDGIVNVCSGVPVSVRSFVEQYCARRGYEIDLELGYFSYPTYEPFAMWGEVSKLQTVLK